MDIPPAELLSEFQQLLRTIAKEVGMSAVVPAVEHIHQKETGQLKLLSAQIVALDRQMQRESQRRSEWRHELERQMAEDRQRWEDLVDRQTAVVSARVSALDKQMQEQAELANARHRQRQWVSTLSAGLSAATIALVLLMIVITLLQS